MSHNVTGQFFRASHNTETPNLSPSLYTGAEGLIHTSRNHNVDYKPLLLVAAALSHPHVFPLLSKSQSVDSVNKT